MPTVRPRHVVTETDDLAAALDAAAERWPGVSRPQLLVRLALEAAEQAEARTAERRRRRREAVARNSGAATGVYGSDYLDELRREWNE